MKRFILSSVLSLITLVGICQTKKIDGIEYYITSSTEVEVEEVNEKVSGNIAIPEFVTIKKKQYRVISIGNFAFSKCNRLTSIIIPEGVTSIGDDAFYGCSSLTSITLPEGVTSIGGGAFYKCSSLTSIIIPEGVTSIGSYAFCLCKSLQEIVIPNSVSFIGKMTFGSCEKLETIIVPDECSIEIWREMGGVWRSYNIFGLR